MKGKLDQLAEENMGQFLTQEQCVQPTPHTETIHLHSLSRSWKENWKKYKKYLKGLQTRLHCLTAALSNDKTGFCCATEHLESLFAWPYQQFKDSAGAVRSLSLPVVPALAAVNLSDAATETHLGIFNTSLVESTFTTASACLYTLEQGMCG